MGIRKTTFSLDGYYHIYTRGVDKRLIFLNDEDRKRFIRLLYISNGIKPVMYRESKNKSLKEIIVGDKVVAIGAYCLMPNHFHLVVKEINEGGIVKFMSKLLTAYSSYFNKKHKRNGALFGSEFKSSHVDTDVYLKYMFAYVHLNPVKLIDPNWKDKEINIRMTEDFLRGYLFSSYVDYIGEEREEKLILSPDVFPEYFENPKEWVSYMRDWLTFEPDIFLASTTEETPQ